MIDNSHTMVTLVITIASVLSIKLSGCSKQEKCKNVSKDENAVTSDLFSTSLFQWIDDVTELSLWYLSMESFESLMGVSGPPAPTAGVAAMIDFYQGGEKTFWTALDLADCKISLVQISISFFSALLPICELDAQRKMLLF